LTVAPFGAVALHPEEDPLAQSIPPPRDGARADERHVEREDVGPNFALTDFAPSTTSVQE
jgi:hypothetical protein